MLTMKSTLPSADMYRSELSPRPCSSQYSAAVFPLARQAATRFFHVVASVIAPILRRPSAVGRTGLMQRVPVTLGTADPQRYGCVDP
jgi:hypothetical protein